MGVPYKGYLNSVTSCFKVKVYVRIVKQIAGGIGVGKTINIDNTTSKMYAQNIR